MTRRSWSTVLRLPDRCCKLGNDPHRKISRQRQLAGLLTASISAFRSTSTYSGRSRHGKIDSLPAKSELIREGGVLQSYVAAQHVTVAVDGWTMPHRSWDSALGPQVTGTNERL